MSCIMHILDVRNTPVTGKQDVQPIHWKKKSDQCGSRRHEEAN